MPSLFTNICSINQNNAPGRLTYYIKTSLCKLALRLRRSTLVIHELQYTRAIGVQAPVITLAIDASLLFCLEPQKALSRASGGA